jgi:hypothetical protein
MAKNKVYVIIKHLPIEGGRTQNVVLVGSTSEVLEFNNKDEAENLASIFQSNSERGFKYTVKEI